MFFSIKKCIHLETFEIEFLVIYTQSIANSADPDQRGPTRTL